MDDMFYCKLTEELDKVYDNDEDRYNRFCRHYICQYSIDNSGDQTVAIRIPGRTIGYLTVNNNCLVDIVIYEGRSSKYNEIAENIKQTMIGIQLDVKLRA